MSRVPRSLALGIGPQTPSAQAGCPEDTPDNSGKGESPFSLSPCVLVETTSRQLPGRGARTPARRGMAAFTVTIALVVLLSDFFLGN